MTPSRSCLARYAGWPNEAMSAASSSMLRPRMTSPGQRGSNNKTRVKALDGPRMTSPAQRSVVHV